MMCMNLQIMPSVTVFDFLNIIRVTDGTWETWWLATNGTLAAQAARRHRNHQEVSMVSGV